MLGTYAGHILGAQLMPNSPSQALAQVETKGSSSFEKI